MTAARLADCNRTLNGLLPGFAGREFSDALLSEFATALARLAMPKSKTLTGAQTSALLYSMKHMLGHAFNVDLLKRNAQRILANWAFIQDGTSIPTWNGNNTETDVIILGVSRVPTASTDQLKYMVKMRLKSGLCAGIISSACLYETGMQMFLDRFSGCRKYNCPPEEISGMEARVVLSMRDGLLKIHSWKCTEKQKQHNKELCEYRSNPRKCKRVGTWCNTCPCTTKECNLAVWLPPEEV